MIRELSKQILVTILLTEYVVLNFLFGKWLFETFGIAGLIGWGLGFFLVSGGIYFYFEGRSRR